MNEDILFNPECVHFMWDDTLKGKKCFVADNIGLLKHYVEGNDVSRGLVAESGDNCYPFMLDDDDERAGSLYQFAYYDPNYDVKWEYYKGGKTVQSKKKDCFADWTICPNPLWRKDTDYRVLLEDEKPKEEKPKHMTYRQLAEWLAKGKGQYTPLLSKTFVSSAMDYDNALDDKELPEGYKIRYWGCDEWIEPTEREYLVAVKHVNPDMSPAEYHYQETCI